MTQKAEARLRLLQICRGTSSTKEFLADLKSGPADSRGFPYFPGAVKFATSLNFADLDDERTPIEHAIERLAEAGDEAAISLRRQLSPQGS
ncbi:MAG TPA: hypothetical protein VGC79_14610 [Polyangiaceae bacterium]